MQRKDNDSGELSVVKMVVGVFIIAILASALLPTAIDSLAAGKNSSGTWSPAETTTFGTLGIIILIVVISGLAGLAYKSLD